MADVVDYFNPDRTDYARILSLIPTGARVLDLGCGSGDLLYRLRQEKGIRGTGVEIAQEKVIQALEQGLSVHHGDIESCLSDYPDGSFDFVVMNHTLQVIKRPLPVLREMVRIGRRGILVFPNFAHWQSRLNFLLQGRLPGVSPACPWYDTPNIRPFSIQDLRRLCQAENIRILREEALFLGQWLNAARLSDYTNIAASMALFLVAASD